MLIFVEVPALCRRVAEFPEFAQGEPGGDESRFILDTDYVIWPALAEFDAFLPADFDSFLPPSLAAFPAFLLDRRWQNLTLFCQ